MFFMKNEQTQSKIDYESLSPEHSSKCGKCNSRGCWLVWIFIMILIILVLFLLWWFHTTKNPTSAYGQYSHAAVASDSGQCSEIGRNVLLENGSAVDAAIATLFCIGIHCAHSSGIGGGFHMVIHDVAKNKTWAIDARETAPASATEQAFFNKSLPLTGALSIGVPGEIKGYHEAWLSFGRLPWSRLVRPTIDLCRNGYIVEQALAKALKEKEETIRNNSDLGKLFLKTDGTLYQEGDKMYRLELANTLETIVSDPLSFYSGSLANAVLQDLQEIGANFTSADLANYHVKDYDALAMPLRNGDVIHTLRPPSSGVLLGFMLQVLEGFNLTSRDFRRITTYQKFIETFKFSYALRTYLGDDTFVNVSEIMQNLTSHLFVDYIRDRINVSYTQSIHYYNPVYLLPPNDHGTSHVSIIDADGSIVSVTSTINSYFGSGRVGSRTGIIFNDEINDFLLPGMNPHPSGDSVPPFHFANQIFPGKRPMSSMCPIIVMNKEGRVTMVIGAAGSTFITSATAYVAAHVMWMGLDMRKAVDELRLHHQLQPDIVSAELNFPKEPLQALRAKNHVVPPPTSAHAVVEAIHSTCDLKSSNNDGTGCLLAVSDWRKGGAPSGY